METRPVLFLCAVNAGDFSTAAATESAAGAACGSGAASGRAAPDPAPVDPASGTSNRVAADSPGRFRRSREGREEGLWGRGALGVTGLATAGAGRTGSVHQDGSCGGASVRSESTGTAPETRTVTGTTTSAGEAPP